MDQELVCVREGWIVDLLAVDPAADPFDVRYRLPQ